MLKKIKISLLCVNTPTFTYAHALYNYVATPCITSYIISYIIYTVYMLYQIANYVTGFAIIHHIVLLLLFT